MGLKGHYSTDEDDSMEITFSDITSTPVLDIGVRHKFSKGHYWNPYFSIFFQHNSLPKLKAAIKRYEDERGREASIATAREVGRKARCCPTCPGECVDALGQKRSDFAPDGIEVPVVRRKENV